MLKIFIGKEKYKIGIMIILLACACIFIYIFHNVIKIGAFFTHLFYIPIILASIWWKKKGLIVPVFLSILLITSHIFFRGNIVTINDYLRASMFITIGVVAAILSERIWKANKMLQQKTYELSKRNKEINCLYKISKFVEEHNVSLLELLDGIVDYIPIAWQYAEIACARIILDEGIFQSDNFKETIWKQAQDIIVNKKKIGAVEVFYLEEVPIIYEGPFLKEERNLINAIVERLGKITERKYAEQEVYYQQVQ